MKIKKERKNVAIINRPSNIKMAYLVNAISVIGLFILLQGLMMTGHINHYITGILIIICINVILAVSLNLTTGVLGQIALGHAGFMSIGAYTAALVTKTSEEPTLMLYFIALIIGGIMAGFVGLIIGLPVLRLRGDYLAIITLAFGEIIRVIIEFLSITGGAQGLRDISKMSTFPIVFWITVLVIFFMFTLGRSRHGRAIISIREDEIAAEAAGIKTSYYKTMAFVIAAFFAGVAGGMFAHYIGILGASNFGFMRSIEILVMVVLGGMGSFTGSIIAAVLLTALPEILREVEAYRMLAYSGILILMMIFKPTGIFGRYEISLVTLPRDAKKYVLTKKETIENWRRNKKSGKRG